METRHSVHTHTSYANIYTSVLLPAAISHKRNNPKNTTAASDHRHVVFILTRQEMIREKQNKTFTESQSKVQDLQLDQRLHLTVTSGPGSNTSSDHFESEQMSWRLLRSISVSNFLFIT